MTRRALAAVLLMVGGCTSAVDTDGDDTDTADNGGCPENMHPAINPGMLITNFRINGLDRNPLFDDAEYLDRPAGCIGDDGLSIDYLFILIDEPYGRLFMDIPQGGESYDLNGTVATMEIELFGETGGPAFQNGEWVTGTWFASSVGATFDSDMNGTGLDDDGGSNSLQINLTVQGTR